MRGAPPQTDAPLNILQDTQAQGPSQGGPPIISWEANEPIYGLAFSNKLIAHDHENSSVLVGVTSCKQAQNSISILEMQEHSLGIEIVAQIEEYYPCTKMQWIPQNNQFTENIFATTSDYLRIYKTD